MSLVNLQIELASLLPLLERLVLAVERIAGPVPADIRTGQRKSDISDLYRSSTQDITVAESAADEFARMHKVMPGSEAFMQRVKDYEKQVIDGYGQAEGSYLVSQLPWNASYAPLVDKHNVE